MVLALAAPMLAAAPITPSSAAPHAHPALLQMASESPDSLVNVIVQKSGSDNNAEDLVTKLGGEVTQDLHIINAFGARIVAGAVPELSSSASVRWVSMDSPVTKSSATEGFTTWATQQAAANSSSISSAFNSTPISANKYIWFNTILRVNGLGSTPVTMVFHNANVAVNVYGQTYNISVPSAVVTYDPAAATATTSYDEVNGRWVTRVPSNLGGSDIFLTGMGVRLTSGLPGLATSVNLSGRFTSDAPGVTVTSWQWLVVSTPTSRLTTTCLASSPVTTATRASTITATRQAHLRPTRCLWSTELWAEAATTIQATTPTPHTATPTRTFTNAEKMLDSAQGPNNTYESGSNVTQDFSGFVGEMTPGMRVSMVEVAFKAYAPTRLPSIRPEVHPLRR